MEIGAGVDDGEPVEVARPEPFAAESGEDVPDTDDPDVADFEDGEDTAPRAELDPELEGKRRE